MSAAVILKCSPLKQPRDLYLALPQRASGHSQKGLEQNFPLGCSSCGDIEYEGILLGSFGTVK